MTLQNPVIQLALPLFVVVMMFAVGTTLTLEDLRRVLGRPRGLLVGILTHALLFPLVALALGVALGLPRNLAVGFVLIASCPAAAPANLFTHLARGDTMLSVCLTAAASLTSVVSVPVFVNLALRLFPSTYAEVRLPVMGSALVLFAVATLPVAAGMLLRRVRPAAARGVEARVGVLGLLAIPVLVAAVVFTEKDRVFQALAGAGGLALLLNALSVSLVWGVSALAGLDRRQRIPVVLECSLQNFAVAAFVCLTLLADPSLLLAPLAYGLTCFLPAMVIVGLARRTG